MMRLGYQWYQLFVTQIPKFTSMAIESYTLLLLIHIALLFVPVLVGVGRKGVGLYKYPETWSLRVNTYNFLKDCTST